MKGNKLKHFINKAVVVSIFLMALTAISTQAAPKPKFKPTDTAVLTVLHAIPASFGADKVDVYSNDELILNDATPGAIKSFTVTEGSRKIDIYPDGVQPSSTTTPLLSYRAIYLSRHVDVTYVAHLNESGKPTLSLFRNKNTEPGKKRAWLTVRHVAAAPAVDIKTDSVTIFKSLSSGYERKVSLRFGTYSVSVLIAGTSSAVLPTNNVTIKDNQNQIIYLWGAASNSSLQYLSQKIETK